MRTHLARPLVFLGLFTLTVSSSSATPGTLKALYSDRAPAAPAAPVPGPRPEPRPQSTDWSLIASQGPDVVTHALVYDANSRRVLLIGGGGSGYSNGVWTLPLEGEAGWSLLATAGRPPSPRRSLAAIYDSQRRRAIVFGGYDGTFLGDLWQLTLGQEPTWSRLEAEGSAPPTLAAAAAVYDSKRDRMIVVHGNDGVAPAFRNGGVWALDLSGRPRWRALAPAGPGPAPRSAHTAVYDPRNDRVVVFGGTTPEFSDELWELRLDGRVAWRRLDLAGPRPSAREEHCAAFDPERHEMLLYGGVGSGTDYAGGTILALHDAWALALDPVPHWRQLPDGPDPFGRWGHRAVFDPVARHMIIHGGWGWTGSTLALASPPATRRAPIAAASAPAPNAPSEAPLRLGIRATNPARGALWLRLALPSAEAARLELFDVAGRRVASREVAGLGPGLHRYRWDETSRLSSGLYLLRFSTAREVVRARVILLR